MGTSALVATVGGPPALGRDSELRIADLERRWSRFRPDSELSRLNLAAPGGRPTTVSADTYRLVERAVDACHLTAGRYDPTVHDAVNANGYDRTFDALPADRTAPDVGVHPAPGCSGVVLDRRRRTVTLPAGVAVDPGGIGKGLAADLVADELIAAGAAGALVDLGGDVRVVGDGPADGRWVVDVEDPRSGTRPLVRLSLSDAGIATSSRLRRRWSVDGTVRHHLIDPSTGSPATTRLVGATVVAGAAWWAEAVTKVVMVSGSIDDVVDASALATTDEGTLVGTADLLALAA